MLWYFSLAHCRFGPSAVDLAPCTGLTEISISLIGVGTSLGMESDLALLLTISSPHLQMVFLALNVKRLVRKGELYAKIFSLTMNGELSKKCFYSSLPRVIIASMLSYFSAVKCTSSVSKMSECRTFMSRFQKVGRVEVRFMRKWPD